MGNKYERYFPPKLVHHFGKLFGRGGIQCTGRFIENKNLWAFEQCPGNRQVLLLAARKTYAPFTESGPVAVRQGFDDSVDFRQLAGLYNLLEDGVGLAAMRLSYTLPEKSCVS